MRVSSLAFRQACKQALSMHLLWESTTTATMESTESSSLLPGFRRLMNVPGLAFSATMISRLHIFILVSHRATVSCRLQLLVPRAHDTFSIVAISSQDEFDGHDTRRNGHAGYPAIFVAPIQQSARETTKQNITAQKLAKPGCRPKYSVGQPNGRVAFSSNFNNSQGTCSLKAGLQFL